MDDMISRTAALAAITLGNTVTQLHAAIRALPADTAVKAASCQPVRIKPLVWRRANLSAWGEYANAGLLRYRMTWTYRDDPEVWFTVKCEHDGRLIYEGGDEDAAKDAANTDCAALIRTAIEPQTDPRDEVSDAAHHVLAERQRQISAEGWTTAHDDQHDCGELASAAACYAAFTAAFPAGDPSSYWPWSKDWWKPSDDKRRNLVKAGALILAEIERLDRAAKGGAA